MRIVHISDLHFPTKLALLSLRGKSIIGYLNYYVRRMKKHSTSLITTLISEIKNMKYDLLIISGDLTNVSHPNEFNEAKRWLEPLLDNRVFIIPGNHDRYKTESIYPNPVFEEVFGEYLGERISSAFYLRKKTILDKVIIGWDSNRPLSITKANGHINPDIVAETNKLVKSGYMLVCHHPIWNPNFYIESNSHKLINRKEISDLLTTTPPSIYFHGHTHTNWVKKPGKKAPYYVINSASSTRFSDSHHDCGFHIVDVNDSGNLDIKRMSYNPRANSFQGTNLLIYEEDEGQI